MVDFNFGNAFMHFARTAGPRGFVWKYVLACLAVEFTVIMLLLVLHNSTVVAAAPDTLGDPALAAAVLAYALGGAVYLVLPLSLLIYAVFEAAALRRYIRREGFRLRLGRDELRMFVVLLIWVAFSALAVVVFSALAVPLVGESETLIAALSTLGILGYLYLATRFSPAAALTIRDRRIRFFQAWRVTEGKKGWLLMSVYALWFVVGAVAYAAVFSVLVSVLEPSSPDSPAASGLAASLAILLLTLAASAAFLYIWAGPAALAARADGEDADLTAEVFS